MTLSGRIGLLAAADHRRLLAIEIAPRHGRTDQLVALGHELQHAVEIAGAPSVWDARSMAAFYTAIGTLIGDAAGLATYETVAAAETGSRVRSDLANFTTSADLGVPRN